MSNDKFDTARQVLRQQKLTGERALFQSENLAVYDSVFEDGESPLKESSSLYLDNCLFRWKYPLWYCKHVDVKECTWFDMARAGVWYTDDISVRDSIVEAPKNFRRCRGVTLTNVNFPNAEETLWNCTDVNLSYVQAHGDYFAMNCKICSWIILNWLEIIHLMVWKTWRSIMHACFPKMHSGTAIMLLCMTVLFRENIWDGMPEILHLSTVRLRACRACVI